MGIRSSPIVRRRRLANELRRIRDEAGIKASDVAAELGCSPGKISQLETGRVSISVPDTKAMLEFYGVSGDRRDELVELARAAKQRGWWLPYADSMRSWFAPYVGLETESSVLRGYQSEFVPGLLQTEEYQRALLAAEPADRSAREVDQLVALRKGRQEILTGPDAPRSCFVVNEAVLRRCVGRREVMAGQLQRLLEAGRQDGVTIQVLPFASGAHAAMTGAFMLVEFPDPADPPFVYVEHLTGARYIEEDGEVARYRVAFDCLVAGALSKTRSAALIREVCKEL
jgi:transcriptional regulator with XRE-family HTH domain